MENMVDEWRELSARMKPSERQLFDDTLVRSVAEQGTEVMHCATLLFPLVKKVKENVDFNFSISKTANIETRAIYPKLCIFGGTQNSTGVFYDSSRTMNMDVLVK